MTENAANPMLPPSAQFDLAIAELKGQLKKARRKARQGASALVFLVLFLGYLGLFAYHIVHQEVSTADLGKLALLIAAFSPFAGLIGYFLSRMLTSARLCI